MAFQPPPLRGRRMNCFCLSGRSPLARHAICELNAKVARFPAILPDSGSVRNGPVSSRWTKFVFNLGMRSTVFRPKSRVKYPGGCGWEKDLLRVLTTSQNEFIDEED